MTLWSSLLGVNYLGPLFLLGIIWAQIRPPELWALDSTFLGGKKSLVEIFYWILMEGREDIRPP